MLRAPPSSAWCRRAISVFAAGVRSMATPRDEEPPRLQNNDPDQLGLRPCGPSCAHACASASSV